MRANRFFDPLYGRIEFTEREMNLILSPEVQRLRYVRMCNINSLLVSGASEPRRFEHIIGVMHLAKQWTAANRITGDEAEVLHAAALLHDVQTGPFGHSMEYILADNSIPGDFRHDDVAYGSTNLYLQRIRYTATFAGYKFNANEQIGRLWERVTQAIKGEGPYGQLVAGRVDLDNIDNVVRLAYHVGVATSADARLGIDLARDLRINDRQLSASSLGIELLRRWQKIRRRLYELLLRDWAEFSAKAMLTAVMELAVEYKLLGAADWIRTDDQLLQDLIYGGKGEAQQIGELSRRLLTGDLFTPIALWHSSATEAYRMLARTETKRELEELVNQHIGGRCIFHVILDRGKTEREIMLHNRDTGKYEQLGNDTNDLLIGVFVSKSPQASRTQRACEELLDRLAEFGVTQLSTLPDPMCTTRQKDLNSAEIQLGLFGG
ncbi:MAG: hypothetical protein ABS69_01795 [Nitrosomonadales bacterium SCN 54-20]|nr:MAG: hypothetical protein ABS69_01795 [Nitrosomonadales bacterium SCN 54-20]